MVTRVTILVNALGAIAVTTAVLVANGSTGTRATSTQAGVVAKPILAVGDAVNGYRLAGAPDAIDAFDNGDGTFTLLVHRRGGHASRWVVSADDFTLLDGADAPQTESATPSKEVDASAFLGDGWSLRVEPGRVVALRPSLATF